MSRRRFGLEQYAEALRQAGGNRAEAAASLGCTVSAIHNIVRSHPELKELCIVYPRPAGPTRRYCPDQVADALRRAGGSRRQAARLLDCAEQTVSVYIRRYPEVKAALDACPPRLKSPEQIIDALRQANGNRDRAAQLLGMARCTLGRYIRRYPSVREACAAIDQARQEEPSSPTPKSYSLRYSPEKVIEALRRAGGIKSHAATLLHCNYKTVDAYIERYPEVREAWIDVRDTLLDAAESKLVEAIDRGEWQAVRFMLLTLGKDRGYTMRPTPTPQEPAVAESERLNAQFEAELRKVYGQQEQEDD